jgi:hypothetical protein
MLAAKVADHIGGYRVSRDCLVVTVCNQTPDPVADDE